MSSPRNKRSECDKHYNDYLTYTVLACTNNNPAQRAVNNALAAGYYNLFTRCQTEEERESQKLSTSLKK